MTAAIACVASTGMMVGDMEVTLWTVLISDHVMSLKRRRFPLCMTFHRILDAQLSTLQPHYVSLHSTWSSLKKSPKISCCRKERRSLTLKRTRTHRTPHLYFQTTIRTFPLSMSLYTTDWSHSKTLSHQQQEPERTHDMYQQSLGHGGPCNRPDQSLGGSARAPC